MFIWTWYEAAQGGSRETERPVLVMNPCRKQWVHEIKACWRRQEEVIVEYAPSCLRCPDGKCLHWLGRNEWEVLPILSSCCHWQFIPWHSNNLSGWNIVPLWFGSPRGVPGRCQSIWTLAVPNQSWVWKQGLVCSESCDVWNGKWKKQSVSFSVALSVAEVCEGVGYAMLVWSYFQVCLLTVFGTWSGLLELHFFPEMLFTPFFKKKRCFFWTDFK